MEIDIVRLGEPQSQEDKVARTSWVQCNICNKWRSLPQVHNPLQILPCPSNPFNCSQSFEHHDIHSSSSV